MSDTDAVAVANAPECVATMASLGPCWRASVAEEADGFLCGNKNTLAADLVKSWPKKPSEFRLLFGIALPWGQLSASTRTT
jgi:hypothetical protein